MAVTLRQPSEWHIACHARSGEIADRDARLRAIGEMTAEFAHQVRTPLTSTLLYAGQLDRSTPTNKRIADRIISGLNELKRIADDMLGYAAGAQRADERIDVVRLLHDVERTTTDQLGEQTNLRVAITDPTLIVSGNKFALKGALLNLVTNADIAADGAATILLHAHRYGDRIHISVTDDGPGIPDEVQTRLFEPFFTTRKDGTGLGLAIVDAVASSHGGRVTVSTSKLGSTFSIELPLCTLAELQE